ncbi:type 4b pilus protein PilO2 [Noviherbaspirillum malthae]|uniref:type 4b pilus protein PilO2 n=1 Tax=Noviherbaspirillum malthae TaxID=1260987 RepID=UPI00188E763C|nr:type 4b pilus protein PilO2 [Noviherbaspirillum malthae]
MTTSFLKVGRRGKLAFGLEWSTLPGVGKQRSEIKELIKRHDARRVTVFHALAGGAIVGLLKTKTAVKGQVLSAAAMFARRADDRTAMFCHDLGNGFYSFIGVAEGMPLPGYDVVGTPHHIANVAAHFKDLHGDVSIPLYGTVAIGGQDPSVLTPEQLIGNSKKRAKDAVLRATKIPAEYLVLALIAGACAIAGPKMYAKWEADRAAERARAEQESQQKLDPNAWYASAVTPILATAGYPAAKATDHLLEQIDVLPLYHAGWMLESASCTYQACSLVLTMEPGSSLSEIKSNPLPGIKNVAFDVKAKSLSGEIAVNAPSKDWNGIEQASLPFIGDFDFAQDDSNIKNEGIFKPVVRTPPVNIVAMPPSIQQTDIRNAVVMGTWKYDGDIHGVDVIRSLPANMTLDSITVNLKSNPFGFKAEGKYYAKN